MKTGSLLIIGLKGFIAWLACCTRPLTLAKPISIAIANID